MESVIQDTKECYICKTTIGLHSHHILYGTASRRLSELYGFKVWLCGRHHNLSNEGVHFNKELDLYFKRLAQEYYEENYGCRLDFIDTFGRNYLD